MSHTEWHRFHRSSPFQPICLQKWQECRFWLAAVQQSPTILSNKQVEVQTCTYCTLSSSHANTVYLSLLMMVAFEVLTESNIWSLTTARGISTKNLPCKSHIDEIR